MFIRVFVPGGLIILLAFYATEWLEASPIRVLVTLVDHSFHNNLHTFKSHPNITKHAAQMGYDYTSQRDAHTYGLKRITSLDAQYVWLFYRDNWYVPEQGMSAAKMEEYDQNACIRDPNATDPAFRYYIAWITHGPSGGDSVALGFYTNYQSETVTTAAIYYLNANVDWSNIDAGFIDQIGTSKGFYTINAQYQFSSVQIGGVITSCANPGPQDYSFSAGFLRYRQGLHDLFHSRGLPVSGNPYEISSAGQEVHATAPFDHYYNESGISQDASTFGIVPANIVTVEVPAPPRDTDRDIGLTFAAAGTAGKQGSWFGSYGEAWEWILSPGMNAIQLLRAIPNWDNLVNATGRAWDGAVYRSSQSYADQRIVYSRHPKTGKLFVVFRSRTAVLPLRASETVVSVQCVDDIFIERGDCAGNFAVNGSEIRLTGSGQLNDGYIVEVR